MNVNQNNFPEDEFFKEAASLYIDRQGEDLLKEVSYINSLPMEFFNIDRVSEKIKAKRRASRLRRISAALIPSAACIAVIIAYFAAPGAFSQKNAAPSDMVIASETSEAQLLPAVLPLGYKLTKTAMDNGQMICYIKSDNNDIILVMEQWQDIDQARPMTELNVNGTPMYALQMNDYSLLTYKKGELRITLTSPNDYRDLVAVGGALV